LSCFSLLKKGFDWKEIVYVIANTSGIYWEADSFLRLFLNSFLGHFSPILFFVNPNKCVAVCSQKNATFFSAMSEEEKGEAAMVLVEDIIDSGKVESSLPTLSGSAKSKNSVLIRPRYFQIYFLHQSWSGTQPATFASTSDPSKCISQKRSDS
jgi:hypothetical protein